MKFDEMWPHVVAGASARRSGWNGKGLSIELGSMGSATADCVPTIPYVVIIGDGVGGASLGHNCGIWTPSMADLFADDWEIIS